MKYRCQLLQSKVMKHSCTNFSCISLLTFYKINLKNLIFVLYFYSGLVPTFGLNDADIVEGSFYVNFGSGKSGAFIHVFFKLLRICNLRLNDNLESINAVLGSPILMPDDLDMPEPTTADYMIHCINWFR